MPIVGKLPQNVSACERVFRNWFALFDNHMSIFQIFDVDNDIFDMRIFSVCVRRIGVIFNSLVSSVTEIDSKDTIFEVV